MFFPIAFFALIILLILWFVFTYNKFIVKNNKVKQTESSISVMLKQRNDMIPNLVAAVQNYMVYENATLTRITELRALIQQSNDEQEQIKVGTDIDFILYLST